MKKEADCHLAINLLSAKFNCFAIHINPIIPLIIIGSLPLILTSLPVESLANAMAPYAEKLNILYAMTMNFMTLYLAISLGAELARMYEEQDATIISIVTVACYIITVAPVNLADNVLDVTGFSAKGMFTLFVVAVIVVEFMHLHINIISLSVCRSLYLMVLHRALLLCCQWRFC